MGRLPGTVLGIAVLVAVSAGTAIPSGAVTDRRTPSVVEAKKKPKKPKKALTACKLLTGAEITAALGIAPTEPPTTDEPGQCYYSAPDHFNFINTSTSDLVVTPSGWVQQAQGADATIPVAGIGDQAFRSANNLTIMVRKGKRTVRIDQYLSGLSETVIESLGKTATSRL
jgi:hypothetical protein